MNAQSVLRELAAHGASVYPDAGMLRVKAPRPVPDELMHALRSRKPEILAILRDEATAPDADAGPLATALVAAGTTMWQAVLTHSPQRYEAIATFRDLSERWRVWYKSMCAHGQHDAAYVENIALRANLEAQRDHYRRELSRGATS